MNALYPPITLGEWEAKKEQREKQRKEMELYNRLPIYALKQMYKRRRKRKNPYLVMFANKPWSTNFTGVQ